MNPIGKPFVQIGEVESSNNYATTQVQTRLAEHGAAWFASHQTAGKGQRGKSWQMEAGANIILSIVIEPKELNQANIFLLSAAAALACYDLFSKYASDETKIKWPNDVYWRDRKAGGILIENIFMGNKWKYAVVGIGININQVTFPPDLLNPVSLKQITGKNFDCVELAQELCEYLEHWWQQLQAQNFDEVICRYNEVLYKKGEKVKFKKEGATVEAIVTGVNAAGELIVNTGSDVTIPYGEWNWVIEKA